MSKLEAGQWKVEAPASKESTLVRTRSSHISFRTARDEVTPEATKKLKVKAGTKLNVTAPNGNVYFTTATKV